MNNKDITYQIFNHLDINNIIRCSIVNKFLKEICDLQYMQFGKQ